MHPNERQKEALVLVASHLQSEGYHDVYALLKQQAPFLARHSLAENIDLNSIVIDWTSSYEERFRRRPIIISRQIGVGDSASSSDIAADASAKGSESRKKQAAAARRRAALQYGSSGTGQGAGGQQSSVLKQVENRLGVVGVGAADGATAATGNGTVTCNIGTDENELTVPSISGQSIATLRSEQDDESIVAVEDRLLKPLPSFGGDLELQALARSIQREIIQADTGVKWDDIVGLDDTKRLLKEAVVIPLLYPSLGCWRLGGAVFFLARPVLERPSLLVPQPPRPIRPSSISALHQSPANFEAIPKSLFEFYLNWLVIMLHL